ncbi:MAG: hypothetical protein U0792_01785 [Gemmataceae bacterium]
MTILASNLITEADAGLFSLPVLHGLHELDLSDNKELGAEGVVAGGQWCPAASACYD